LCRARPFSPDEEATLSRTFGPGWPEYRATVKMARIRQTGRIGESLVEIEFLDAGAEAYCFTFG